MSGMGAKRTGDQAGTASARGHSRGRRSREGHHVLLTWGGARQPSEEHTQ